MNEQVVTAQSYAWNRLVSRLDSARTRADLANLRRGLGKEPGAVPQLWPTYTRLRADGAISDGLRAEHACLCLFGIHQQSHSQPMHKKDGLGLGQAMRLYRLAWTNTAPDRDPDVNAVDKRMAALASSTTFRELEEHLRRAVTLLRSEGIAIDYDRLCLELIRWQRPQYRSRVVRSWGSGYYVPVSKDNNSESAVSSQKGEPNE